MSQLEGAFALLIKSTHYPQELIAAKKGSPLLLGAPSRTVPSWGHPLECIHLTPAERPCLAAGTVVPGSAL